MKKPNLSLDDDEINDRENLKDPIKRELDEEFSDEYGTIQRARLDANKLQKTPDLYDNDCFDSDIDEHQDRGDDEDDEADDPLREDVSSEGSCRTSIYQRS